MSQTSPTIPPNPVPLKKAARKPIGRKHTGPEILLEIIVCILLPFIVPAALLAFHRAENALNWYQAISLSDVAFGFVAVAVAVTVRAVTLTLTTKSAECQVFVLSAMLLGFMLVVIGITSDTTGQSNALLRQIQSNISINGSLTTNRNSADTQADQARRWNDVGAQLRNTADTITHEGDMVGLWIVALPLGVVMVITALISIFRIY